MHIVHLREKSERKRKYFHLNKYAIVQNLWITAFSWNPEEEKKSPKNNNSFSSPLSFFKLSTIRNKKKVQPISWEIMGVIDWTLIDWLKCLQRNTNTQFRSVAEVTVSAIAHAPSLRPWVRPRQVIFSFEAESVFIGCKMSNHLAAQSRE